MKLKNIGKKKGEIKNMTVKKSTMDKRKLKEQHEQKLINLYNIYYEKAQTDVNAFKAFLDFSDRFFASNDESSLMGIIDKVHLNELNDEDVIQ